MLIENLNNSIIKCKKCPRLVRFRKKISTEKRKQFINQTYWGKPITGFGDIKGKVLLVGLAPAAHGGIELEEFSLVINPLIFYINAFIMQKSLINPYQHI